MITWPSNSTLPDIVITPLQEGFFIVCPEGTHCEGPFQSLREAEEALDEMFEILHGLLKREAGEKYMAVIRRAISEGLEKYLVDVHDAERARLTSEMFRKFKNGDTGVGGEANG